MVSLIDNGVGRRERRTLEIGASGLASNCAYRAGVSINASVGRNGDGDVAGRAMPADLYRRISFAVWSAAIVVGALSWTAFFHLM